MPVKPLVLTSETGLNESTRMSFISIQVVPVMFLQSGSLFKSGSIGKS